MNRISPVPIQMDLTSWIRAPYSGVGQSAYRSFKALRQLSSEQFTFEAISRAPSVIAFVSKKSRFELFCGSPSTIYHGFELKCPQVQFSKRVITVHDTWTLQPNPYQSPTFQKMQSKLLRKAIQRSHALVVPSSHVAQSLKVFFPNLMTPVHVVPWAPLLDETQSLPSSSSNVLDFLSQKRPFVLSVGCVEVRKNFIPLVRAVEQIVDLSLVVVGHLGFKGKEIVNEWNTLRNSGRLFHFTNVGESELKALYQQCLVFASTSLEEGFGLPVVEALNFHKPLLLSDIPPFRETAGKAALYMEPRSVESVLAQLRKILETPSLVKSLEDESKIQCQKFSWKKVARQLVDLYSRFIP